MGVVGSNPICSTDFFKKTSWDSKPTRAPLVQARAAGHEGAPTDVGAGEWESHLLHHLNIVE
ncbi:MAG TPA: hypothetical protein DCL35_03780 [Candidatus Omnitrophica bacterium]|nr:hypothetical protein [Candidatus Omnitrophota bacterium]